MTTVPGNPPLANPYGDPNLSQPIMALQQNVADILFVRTSYVKKIIEDCSNSEETIKLLRFCCWENPQFSSTVLSELLWQVKIKSKEKDGNINVHDVRFSIYLFIEMLYLILNRCLINKLYLRWHPLSGITLLGLYIMLEYYEKSSYEFRKAVDLL